MPESVATSVAMCTFNGERFLAEQLESIARQSVSPSELVVCDDGSTDATVPILRAFIDHAPFPVRLRVNECRLGSTKNFEQAISLCRGEVIFLADQDDIWRADKMATISDALQAGGQLSCLFTDARLIDDDGSCADATLWQHIGFDRQEQQLVEEGRAFELLVVRNVATGATMALRSRDRDLLLPIPEEHAMVHDRWIALLLSIVSRVGCIPETLIDYRRHTRQQIGPGPRAGSLGARLSAVQVTGPRQFAEWAGQLQLILQRLRERQTTVSPGKVAEIEDRIEHLRARASMPESLVRRLPSVTRELVTGRYHQYSNRFWSVAKDLLRAYKE